MYESKISMYVLFAVIGKIFFKNLHGMKKKVFRFWQYCIEILIYSETETKFLHIFISFFAPFKEIKYFILD